MRTLSTVSRFARCFLFGCGLCGGIVFLWLTMRGADAKQGTTPLAIRNAASFATPVAAESIAVVFGNNLSKNVVVAPSGTLPTQLDGTTVVIRDSAGQERLAPLFYVTPTQISFLLPAGTAQGQANVSVRASDGVTSQGAFSISAAAPGLFTANANGTGVPAAVALRFKSDGSSSDEDIKQRSNDFFTPKPIDLGDERDLVFLVLYATGLRGVPNSDGNEANGGAENVRVLLGGLELTPAFVGPSGFAGAEQINLLVPRSLVGRGRLRLSLAVLTPVTPQTSNQTEIEIAGLKSDELPIIERTSVGEGLSVGASERIEIFGQRFSINAKENTVRVGNREAHVEEASATRLVVRVPFGAESAPLSVVTQAREGRSNAALRIKTSVSGVVKDTRHQPISGVRITLQRAGKSVITDAEGVFVLSDLQDAGIDYLLIDGSTVPFSPGFPSVVVRVGIERNRDNTIASPIYLQQQSGAQFFVGSGGFTGEEELVWTADVPEQGGGTGEIRFTLPAGTKPAFPDGSMRGALVLNAIEHGLTPIKMPDGVFSSSIAQITGFGVRFDRGGKLSFPNTDKLTPGSAAVLYKYDVTPCSANATNCRRGEWVQTDVPVTVTANTIETAENAITETSYYFVANQRLITTGVGRVIESASSGNGQPVVGAVVRVRGQEATTDGNGGFVINGIPASLDDEIAADVSWTRADGRVFRQQGSFVRVVINGLTMLGEIKLETETTNRAPIALLPTIINLTASRSRDLGFSAADPDAGQTIRFEVDNQRVAQIISNGNNLYTLRLTPTLGDAGVMRLILTVIDNLGKSQAYEIRLVIRLPLTARSDTATTDEDSAVNIQLIGNDPEGRQIVYSVGTNPTNGRLTINGNTASYTPNANYNGADRFTFFVNNGVERSDEAAITILIRSINDAPVLTVPTTTQTALPASVLSFLVSAADADNTNLSITSTNLPAGARCRPINSTSCQFEWTPSGLQTGTYQIRFRVEDDDPTQKLSDEKIVAVTVVNRSPSVRGLESQTIDEGRNLSFTLSATDPDPDQSIVFSVRNAPAGASLTPNGQFSWTPGFTQSGAYDLTFTASDNGDPIRSDSTVVQINVVNVNQAPIANDQAVTTNEDATLNFALDAMDSDGDALRYAIVNSPRNGRVNVEGKNVTYTPTADFNGTDSFTFKVNDSALDSNTAVVVVTVRPVNDAPVLTVPGRQQAIVGERLSFKVTASDIDAGQTVRIEAADLPSGASFDAATGELTWTPKLEQRGTQTLNFAAVDNGTPTLTDRKSVEITVSENWRPTNGPTGGTVLTLVSRGTSLFAGVEGGIYVSENSGVSWTLLNGLRGFTVRALFVTESRIYAGTAEDGVFVSENNGTEWRSIKTGLPNRPVLALASAQIEAANLLVAGIYGGGVYVSTDGGQAWREMNEGLPAASREVYALTFVRGRLFAGTNEGVYALSGGQWMPINNGMPGAPHVYSLQLSGQGLYAATNKGVFVTTDGAAWRNLSIGLPTDTAITSLAFGGTALFAGTYGKGIYVQRNNASPWIALSNGLANPYVLSLTGVGTTLLAGTEGGGIYVATGSASNWTALNTGLTTPATASLLAVGSNLFAGTLGGGVFRSSNNGTSWVAANNGLTPRQIYTLRLSGGRLLAGTNDGVYGSMDNGASWTAANNGMPGAPNVYALLVARTRVFAGTNKGVFISTDNGATWVQANAGLPALAVTTLLAVGETVLAGTYGDGIFSTTIGGNGTWTAVNSGLTSLRVLTLATARTRLYAGTEGGGVFVRNGANWTPVNAGLPANLSVASLVANGNSLLAGTANNGVFVTVNEGATWTAFSDGLPQPLTAATLLVNGDALLAGTDKGVFATLSDTTTWKAASNGLTGATALALATNGESLFAGTYGNYAHRTNNDGVSWIQTRDGLAKHRVFALHANGSVVLAGTNDGIYATRNNGASWSEANNGLTGLPQVYAFAATSSGNVFTATNDGVFVSNDIGANWQRVSNGLPPDRAILSLVVNGNSLFAGTFQAGVFVTKDNGTNWTRADNGLPLGLTVLTLAVSGTGLFAGTDKGIFVTRDSGETWTPANTGLVPGIRVMTLAVSGEYLFAGTFGDGLYVSTDNGARWVRASRGLVTSASNNPGNPLVVVTSLTVKQRTLFAGIAGRGVFALRF